MDKIPTAIDLFDSELTCNEYSEVSMFAASEVAIKFAKLHVKAALEVANTKLKQQVPFYDFQLAYPESNIK